MHLAGEPYSRYATGGASLAQHGVGGLPARRPPVFRILLGPSGLRRSEWRMIGRRRRDKPTAIVEEHGARAAGADVDAENGNGPVSSARYGQRPRIERSAATNDDVLAAVDFSGDR